MSVAACDLAVTAAGEAMLPELRARGGPAICLSVPDTQIDPHIRVPAADLMEVIEEILQGRGPRAPSDAGALAG